MRSPVPALLALACLVGVIGCDASDLLRLNDPPCVETLRTTGHAGDVLVTYDLVDPEGDTSTLTLGYRRPGGTWTPASYSGAAVGVPPGMGRTLIWHSDVDLPGVSTDDVQLRLDADDGDAGVPAISNPLVLVNGGPLPPPPAGGAPAIVDLRPFEGCAGVVVEYVLVDGEGSWCELQVEYRGGGAGSFFRPATVSGQTTGVVPNHFGGAREITWRSWQDEPGVWAPDYQLRLTPYDGSWGVPVVTRLFELGNP